MGNDFVDLGAAKGKGIVEHSKWATLLGQLSFVKKAKDCAKDVAGKLAKLARGSYTRQRNVKNNAMARLSSRSNSAVLPAPLWSRGSRIPFRREQDGDSFRRERDGALGGA